MSNFFEKIFLLELLKGMGVVFKHIFIKPVTRLYPFEKPVITSSSRGLHTLMRDEDTGNERCVGCSLCVKICPSGVIHMVTSKGEMNQKRIDEYEIDISRCAFCGLCVDVCPKSAIIMSDRFELAVYDKKNLLYNKNLLLKIGEMKHKEDKEKGKNKQ